MPAPIFYTVARNRWREAAGYDDFLRPRTPHAAALIFERLLMAAEAGTLEEGEATASVHALAHALRDAWIEQEAGTMEIEHKENRG